jgi:hypothetical protein
MSRTYVYIYLEEGPVPAGLLETIGLDREATARFAYGRRYLERRDRLEIDPVTGDNGAEQCPLTLSNKGFARIQRAKPIFNNSQKTSTVALQTAASSI